MVRIAIVEDVREEAEYLKGHIARFEMENGESCKVDVFCNGLDFLDKYKHSYDAIFMDIDMPHIDGMQVARRLREQDSVVSLVFVTNMKQFAIEGYAVSALDFVLKPVSYYRFATIMKRITRNIQKRTAMKIVRTTDGLVQIKLDSVCFVEVMGRDIIYHTETGTVTTRGKLKDLETEFTPHGFIRCNNCYLVNLRHVKSVSKDMIAVGGTQIAVSQRKRKDFITALGAYWGDS